MVSLSYHILATSSLYLSGHRRAPMSSSTVESYLMVIYQLCFFIAPSTSSFTLALIFYSAFTLNFILNR